MSFKAYEEYKNAHMDWLDELPDHWSKSSMRWISKIYSGGTPDKKNQSYWTNGSIPWLNSGSVNHGLISQPSAMITLDAFKSSSAKWIRKNSLVLALAGQGKTKGTVAQVSFQTTCNQSMAAIIPQGKIGERYLYWWLTSNYQNIRNLAGGDLRDGLNLDMLGGIDCPLPHYKEQTTIAAFLDHETARIDALIEEQQRLIALLKEKRQAVISHAVTKGLDPNVPMKDSGVEWLGEVPAHWDVIKASYLGRFFGSENISENMIKDEGELPYLKVGSLSLDGLNIKEWKWFLDESHLKSNCAYKNFITFPKRGAAIFLNKVNIVNKKSLIDPNLMGWKIDSSHKTSYFAYALKCRTLTELADISTVPQINNKHIEPEKFPVPPFQEQGEIISYLIKNLRDFDNLLDASRSAIDLLSERRSALISAAVTGKIDVRDWQPSKANQTAAEPAEAGV